MGLRRAARRASDSRELSYWAQVSSALENDERRIELLTVETGLRPAKYGKVFLTDRKLFWTVVHPSGRLEIQDGVPLKAVEEVVETEQKGFAFMVHLNGEERWVECTVPKFTPRRLVDRFRELLVAAVDNAK